MAASTPMGRMDSIPQATIEALLAMDTSKLDALAKKKTQLVDLAGESDALLSLAEKATELLALLEPAPDDTEAE